MVILGLFMIQEAVLDNPKNLIKFLAQLGNRKRKIFKNISLVFIGLLISYFFFLVSLHNIHDYGETCDERPNQIVGDYYVNRWKKDGSEGINKMFSPKDRYYGPFFARLVIYSQEYFSRENKILNEVEAGHFPIIVFSSLAVFFIFIFSYQSWRSLNLALLSSLLLAVLPRFIGDSQNNPKDLPILTLFLLTFIFVQKAIAGKKYFWLIPAGVVGGLAYSIRIDGFLIWPIILISLFLINKLSFKNYVRVFPYLFISFLLFCLTVLTMCPYYRDNPVGHFIENYKIFKAFPWNLQTLYLGKHYFGLEVPWHYYFVMIGVTTPLMILFPFVFELLLILKTFLEKRIVDETKAVLLSWLLIPLFIQSFSGTPKYDAIRHISMIIPSLILMTSLGIADIAQLLNKLAPKLKTIFFIVIFSGIAFIFIKDVKMHPYQIVYFNELVGGVKSAYGKFDLDYWGVSLKEAASWINKNLPRGSRIKIIPPSEYYFYVNRNDFSLVQTDEDYEVVIIKGMVRDYKNDYLAVQETPIYSIKVDGGDILKIYQHNEPVDLSGDLYLEAIKEVSMKNLKNGIEFTDFDSIDFKNIVTKQIANTINFSSEKEIIKKQLLFSRKIECYLEVKYPGVYYLNMSSDDDAILTINNQKVIYTSTGNNYKRKINFNSSGFYKIEIRFINRAGIFWYRLFWSRDDISYQEIPSEHFFVP